MGVVVGGSDICGVEIKGSEVASGSEVGSPKVAGNGIDAEMPDDGGEASAGDEAADKGIKPENGGPNGIVRLDNGVDATNDGLDVAEMTREVSGVKKGDDP